MDLTSINTPAWASQVVLVVKNPSPSTGDMRGLGLIPGSEKSPGGGDSNPLQDSWLENPMDRGAWWAAVHGVTKSWIELKQLSSTLAILPAYIIFL